MAQVREPQSAAAVLMVRPARFGGNPETAASNAFQAPVHVARSAACSDAAPAAGHERDRALREFDALAVRLERAGIEVIVAADSASPAKPDAVFPNNWVSFHADGTVVLYPMLAENRRRERREEVLQLVVRKGRYRIARQVNLSSHEIEGRYLEGTGSLVLDRANRIAYAGLSPRTHREVLEEFARLLNYHLVIFATADGAGQPIYHTNVLMAVGTGFAALCSGAIARPAERRAVLEKLRSTGHEVLVLSNEQMLKFAGNLLELAPAAGGGPVIALSSAAWQSLDSRQRRLLERHGEVMPSDIPVIERLGGGSVRCMLAEVHLPKSMS